MLTYEWSGLNHRDPPLESLEEKRAGDSEIAGEEGLLWSVSVGPQLLILVSKNEAFKKRDRI
jgi:hypothetical protein